MATSLQDNLIGAVNEAITLTEGGDDPLTAMVKVASARSLLPDQIDRMCQLHNKSVLLTHKIAASTLSERLDESASIVDPRQVRERVLMRGTKQAALQLPATERMLEASRKQLFEPELPVAMTVKRASIDVASQPVDRHAGLHHGVAGHELYELRKTIKAKLAALDDEAERLFADTNTLAAVGVLAVRKLASRDIGPQAIRQVEYRLSEVCRAAIPLLHGTVRHETSNYFQEKHAALTASPPTGWLPGVTGPTGAATYFEQGYRALQRFAVELPGICAKVAGLREELFLLDQTTHSSRVDNRGCVLGSDTLKDRQLGHIAAVASKTADFVQTYLASLMASGGGAKPSSPRSLTPVERFQLKLQHPQHEAQLGSVKTRAALQTLMVDDPVIAATPDEQVVAAFNELSAYSPQITQNPAAFRAVLRQYLQNNSSSFDLAQIKNLERAATKPKSV